MTSNNKTKIFLLIIFLLLAISLISVAFFISGSFGGSGEKLCQNLNEAQCQKNKNCQAIYRQSDNGFGAEFTNCVTLTASQIQSSKDIKKICEQTGGVWQETKYGDYCNCAARANNLIYQKDKGCVEKF